MGWSFHVCRIKGIPVRVHWAFAIVLIYYLYQPLLHVRDDASPLLVGLIFAGMLVVAIICHEFAHAMTARGFGARVHGVTLWPLGGFTELSGMPPSPNAHVWLSLSGPFCNLVLGSLGLASMTVVPRLALYTAAFAQMNLFLGLFNLVPSQPLDGGHALQSILHMRMGQAKGDLWAGRVGVVAGIGVLVLALASNSMWIGFIGVMCIAFSAHLIRTNRFAGYADRPAAPQSGDFRVWRLPKKELDHEVKRRHAAERADKKMRRRVDRILKQISDDGIDSISEDDRTFLRRASHHLRRDD